MAMLIAPYGYPYPYRPLVHYEQAYPALLQHHVKIPESQQARIPNVSLPQPTQQFRKSKAAQYFITGFVAPITGLFESVQSFVLGSAMLAAGFTLYGAAKGKTKGKIAWLYTAGAMAIGLFRLVKGTYDFVGAKTTRRKEESFFSFGNAVSIMGLCALGMKNPFKEASAKPMNLNGFKAWSGLHSWKEQLRFLLTNPVDDCLCVLSQHKSPHIPAFISKAFAADNRK